MTGMDIGSVFQGKKVTVMGLGLLGRGVGDAAYLAEMGAASFARCINLTILGR